MFSATNDIDFDLAWIGNFFFDLVSDFGGVFLGFLVADDVWFDEDADFAAGGDGEGAFDAFVTDSDGFEFFNSFDVFFEGLLTRAGAGSGDGVGGFDEEGFGGLLGFGVVMNPSGVDFFP
mgnify:CR=1 FL=1